MRKNIVLIAGILFMFVMGLQMAGPVSAANLKKIDQGSLKIKDKYGSTVTYKWNTYQKGTGYVEMRGYVYSPRTNRGIYIYIYLKKVGNKVKMYGKQVVKNHNTGSSSTMNFATQYIKTKLTAVQFYWKYVRNAYIYQFKSGRMN